MLRQAIEKQMDRIEHVHRVTRAVSVGNPREFLQAEKQDQPGSPPSACSCCWRKSFPADFGSTEQEAGADQGRNDLR